MPPKKPISMNCMAKQGAPFDTMLEGVKGILCAGVRGWATMLLFAGPWCSLQAQDNQALSMEILLEPGAQFSPGEILASPRFSSNLTYPIVVDSDGTVLYNELNPFRGFNFDFHPDGSLAWFSVFDGVWERLDSSLQAFEFIQFNGAEVDYHDLEILENGHRLLMGTEIVMVTLPDSVPNPDEPDRAVIDCLLEEQDAFGNTIWTWRASDHIPPTWCTHCNWNASLLDAYHHNAFQMLDNGDVLLCLRNMDAVVRINRLTGNLVWVAGGPMSDFTFDNPDNAFLHPHDAQLLENNHLLLFDNATGAMPLISRGVEYILDEESGTLIQWAEWPHPDGNYAASQGSIQRLASGGTLIGWGTASSELSGGGLVTEYNAQGELLGSIHFPENHFSYRARKVPEGMIPLIQGCKEEGACNYNSSAALSDDCISPGDPCNDGNPCTVGDEIQEGCNCAGVLPDAGTPIGCSDSAAVNFDPCAYADVDDGSCQYYVDFRVDPTYLNTPPQSMSIFIEGSPYAMVPGGFGTWKATLLLGAGDWNYHYATEAEVDTIDRMLSLAWPVGEPLPEQRTCFGLPQTSCPGCTAPDDPSYSPFADDDLRCGLGYWVGCTIPEAINYNEGAFFDDGSCAWDEGDGCPYDLDADGVIGVSDILELLSFFGWICP